MNDTNETANESQSYNLAIRGWYRLIRGAVGLLLRLLMRVKVEGREYIRDPGGYMLISNHLHWLDTPILAVVFPYRPYVFAASKWASHFFLGPLLRSTDAIFVRRGEVDRKALRQAFDVLSSGGILGLAPEGTRSKTGALQQGRSGAAYMALRTGVPLLPVVLTGQEKAIPSLRRLRRPTIYVRFGPLFEPPDLQGKATPEQVDAFAQEIMYRLAAMLPPEYRGEYADVERVRPDLVAAAARA
ncbi:MAG: 1-acyl-sn-glycerol-3-phosphate acyltransferase [Anaerolineae bacterium]|nr:1-acyl-sn-glycerol-3-phosphate acyltransferase [Anaerolineae bacterium]